MVNPLSEREREVLRQLPGMLSYAKMHVSVHTVKSYLDNVYPKLGTTGCGEAVRRARQLGLIWCHLIPAPAPRSASEGPRGARRATRPQASPSVGSSAKFGTAGRSRLDLATVAVRFAAVRRVRDHPHWGMIACRDARHSNRG